MNHSPMIAVATSLLVACAASPSPSARPDAPAPTAQVATPPGLEGVEFELGGVARQVRVAKVVVLDRGTGERRALRWALEARSYLLDARVVHQTRGTGASTTIDEGYVLEAALEVVSKPAADGRSIHLGVRIAEARLDQVTMAVHPYVEGERLEGAVFTMLVSPRGQFLGVVAGEGHLSPGLPSLVEAIAMTQLVSLPEEPVGVGARWRIRRAASIGEVAAIEEVTYRVRMLDGAFVALEASVHKLPLFDDAGVISTSAADQPRIDAAIQALETQALNVVDHEIEPSARGQHVAVFPLGAPPFGTYQRTVSMEAHGKWVTSTGEETMPVTVVDQVMLEHRSAAREADENGP